MIVQISALVVMMPRTSWGEEAEKAQARVQCSEGSITLAFATY
jgi:multidrug resistance protein, MATE family